MANPPSDLMKDLKERIEREILGKPSGAIPPPAPSEIFKPIPLPAHFDPALFDDVVPAAPSTRVHILHQGYPLCNFTTKRPVEWPSYNEWVSKTAYEQGASISCPQCASAHTKLK